MISATQPPLSRKLRAKRDFPTLPQNNMRFHLILYIEIKFSLITGSPSQSKISVRKVNMLRNSLIQEGGNDKII